LAQRPRRDREVDHRPNICGDELCGWEAWGELLLFKKFRRQEQPSVHLPHSRLPACSPAALPGGPILTASPDVGKETLYSRMERLIVGTFRATQTSTLIIIDALGECRDEEPASALLSVLSRFVNKIPFVKFFITGRPEPRIRSGFRLESLPPHTDALRLHDIKRSSVDSDIRLFFVTQLAAISKNRSDCNLSEGWPTQS